MKIAPDNTKYILKDLPDDYSLDYLNILINIASPLCIVEEEIVLEIDEKWIQG